MRTESDYSSSELDDDQSRVLSGGELDHHDTSKQNYDHEYQGQGI